MNGEDSGGPGVQGPAKNAAPKLQNPIMPQASNHPKRCGNPQSQTQQKSASFSQPTSNSGAESRKNPRRKKKLMFVKIKGLGCKGNSMPEPSAPRTAGECRQENQGRRRPSSSSSYYCNRKNPGNVVVDVPDVCCTPPGVGIAPDFAPRNRNTAAAAVAASRFHHRKHSRGTRRNGDDPNAIIGSRTNHRSAEEPLRMLMAQQTLLYHRIINGQDRYRQWRLNVDDMSYEELLELSDKIGHVGTGLQEEEISACLRKLKNVTSDSSSWLMTGQKDWKCSICQEKCRRDDEIGRLECGHYHHVQCIKQWLLQKNQCPVCKSAAMPK